MKAIFFFFVLVLLLSACSKDSETINYARPQGCDSIAFSYKNDIAPIIHGNCNLSECHTVGGEGSYDYTNYAVVADRIRTSRFLDRLNLPLDDSQHMPLGFQMNPCEKYSLITWIQQGYPDN